MTHHTYDAIVIGGGIVGTSTAYHLVRGGAHTLLIDRADPGKATYAGAGILVPVSRKDNPHPWHQLMGAAFEFYAPLVAELDAVRAGNTGFAQCGMLIVAASEDEVPFLEQERQRLADSPSTMRELSAAAAIELFPVLGNIYGALYDPAAARVDGWQMASALRNAAMQRGLTVRSGNVEELISNGNTVTGVRANGEAIGAGAVVIAGGAWSQHFGAQLGVRIAVEPQRGQIAHLHLPNAETTNWPIVEGFRGHYILCWPGGHVVAGATRETGSGFDPRTTVSGVMEVLDEALRVAPGLAQASLTEFRVGLRPFPADGLPILGASPIHDNVIIATGHGPNGLQLGPYSGKIAADLILHQDADEYIQAFSVNRFS